LKKKKKEEERARDLFYKHMDFKEVKMENNEKIEKIKLETHEKIKEILLNKKENDYSVDNTYNIYGEKINDYSDILNFIKNKNLNLYRYIQKIDKLTRMNKPKISYQKK